MHSRDTIDRVLEDRDAGIPKARIARERGLPRSTVRDWCDGRIPASRRAPEADPWRDLRALRPGRPVHVARRRPTNCVVVTAMWRHWDRVFPQHGTGPKHLRPIMLHGWQRDLTMAHPESFVRGLLHSDGCRYLNRVMVRGRQYAYPSYGFANASEDIHDLLREHLDLLGVSSRRSNARTTAITTRAAVARLDAFVGSKR